MLATPNLHNSLYVNIFRKTVAVFPDYYFYICKSHSNWPTMKKISTLFLLLSLATVTSKAQLKVPMQYDTLVIKSMEYHFDEIRPENWPFSYVVRTPSSFIFGDQEFKIESSNNLPFEKIFRFESGDYETQVLSLQDYSENITIDFAGYFLVCEKTATTVETSDTTTSVKPYAKLKGRTVQAGLAKPKYNSQEGGTVVVSIWVDQYGNVTKAIAGTDGTTVSDKALWAAARTAAMETRFNMDGDAPVLQEGTITYYFGQIEDVEDVPPDFYDRKPFPRLLPQNQE